MLVDGIYGCGKFGWCLLSWSPSSPFIYLVFVEVKVAFTSADP